MTQQPIGASTAGDSGLEHFGYKETLDRSIGKFASFAAGVSYISILTGTFLLFYFGFGTGGPAYLWSWPLVFAGQLMVALCFMELAAKYPIAGSIFNWAKMLGSKVVGWSAGWMMLTASIAAMAATVLAIDSTLPRIWSGFRMVGTKDLSQVSPENAVLLGAILITLTTLINAFGVKLTALINSIGVFVELVAAVLIIVFLALNIKRGPDVFFHTGGLGENIPGGYLTLFLVAALASANVMYGFDTAASLGEETKQPRKTAPNAILRALLASFVLGGAILSLAVMAAPDLSDPQISEKSGGLQYIVEQVMRPPVGTIFMIAIMVAIFVCVLAVHAATARIAFAMARDNALPFSATLARVHPKFQTPTAPVIVAGLLAIAILLLNINQPTIFTMLTSISVVMIYSAYLLVTVPMLVQRFKGNWPPREPQPSGFFVMGRGVGLVVNICAVLWGAGMALNLAWPREATFGSPWYNTWGAFIYVGTIVFIGLLWYSTVGKRQIGVLKSHAAQSKAEADDEALVSSGRGPEGV